MANFQGNSIVDYLKSVGKPSDFASRSKLAQEQGIIEYGGTAEQNTQLLGKLNKPEAEAPKTTGWQQSPFEQEATFGDTGSSGIDKFVPEASDNIDISEGEASVLQGGQSNWFKTFQDAYVSGQATIQKSIADLMKQQSDITKETREGYQDTIDEAKTGLEEAKDKPYGEELGEELSEKYKLQEKIDKLGEIGNQMAQLQGAYDASVAQTEMSGITIGQSRGELARKQREYASKTSVLQAKSAVITDQYNLVSDIVEKYYNSAESERTAEISRYQNLLDVATKAKLSLTAEDKDQITNQINLLLGEQAKQEANKDKIMALAIDPNTAEAFFSSGASLDDTYEQILEKMSPFMSSYAKQRRLKALNEGGMSVEEILEKQRIEESMIGLSWEIIGVKKQIQDEESKRNPDEDKLKILRSKENTLYSRVSTGDRLELNQKIKDISSNYTEVLGAARQLVEEEGLEPAVNIISADETLDVTTRQNIINKIQSEKAKPKIGIGGIIKTIFTTGLFSPTKYLFKK